MRSWFAPRAIAGRGIQRKAASWSQPLSWAHDGYRLPYLAPYPMKADEEKIGNSFEAYIQQAYKASGIVFACILTRQAIFSQARFQWREYTNGLPGAPFGSTELKLLERPWPNGTTGELLARAELDVSLAGNFWATTADDRGRLGMSATGPGRRIVHMRPDWVTMVIGSNSGNPNSLDARVVGILYEVPATYGFDAERTLLLPQEVCHYSPIPDPDARFRGMSWLTPILREVEADKAATKHKGKFFEHGATPSMVVKGIPAATRDQFDELVDMIEQKHAGVRNAYRTLYLASGADAEVVGADLKQLDFKATQGAGETRIAAAAGVHPVIAAFSEGMQGSSLNAGNFNAARRLSADKTFEHLWQVVSASLQGLLNAPSDRAELWADTRQVKFLRDDAKDAAETRYRDAQTIRSLSDAGAKWDAAVEFVQTGDISKLIGQHSGLFSVQLQPPNTVESVTITDTEKAAALVSAGWKLISISRAPLRELEPPLKELTA